jgi:glutamine synthetase
MKSYDAEQAWAQARRFLDDNPDIETIEVFLTDLNGISRGKWIPRDELESVCRGNYKISVCAVTPDVWGNDVPSLCEFTGDADGITLPVIDTLKRVPWLKKPTAQLMLEMTRDGDYCEWDPRVVLRKVVQRYQERGLTAVMAPELEFYLFDPSSLESGAPCLPDSQMNSRTHIGGQLYSTDMLRDHAEMLHAMRDACVALGVPATAIGKELSAGQWELNQGHVDSPLDAADQAQTLKRCIRSVAKDFDLMASFIAKPSAALDGNGLHVHFSLLDESGKNIFDDGSDKGSEVLRHALGGLAATMSDTMLVMMPHLNSFRRMRIGGHAPKAPTWGYENRYVAMRIPDGPPESRRIEHRVAGADANAYLVLAVMLAGALYGIDNKLDPGGPSADRESGESSSNKLPSNWYRALDEFDASDFVRDYLGAEFKHAFSELKHFEQQQFDSIISREEYDTYLATV